MIYSTSIEVIALPNIYKGIAETSWIAHVAEQRL